MIADDGRAWIGYAAPMIIFGLFTAVEGYLPAGSYPFAYVAKMASVTGGFLVWRRPLRDIQPSWSVVAPSVLVGLAICASWLLIDKLIAYPHLGDRVGFDPFTISSGAGRMAFLAVRLFGLIVLVPVMEELFWRSFLLRYVTNPNFLSLAMGTFSSMALLATVGLSAIAHTEWLVAAVANGIFCMWLRRTRSLFATIVAHAAANAALGAYILVTNDWKYW